VTVTRVTLIKDDQLVSQSRPNTDCARDWPTHVTCVLCDTVDVCQMSWQSVHIYRNGVTMSAIVATHLVYSQVAGA